MGNEINRSLFNHHHRLNGFSTLIIAFFMINFLVMGESYGYVDTWNVHSNEDEIQRTTTKPISSSARDFTVVSTPIQSSANQTLKSTARESQLTPSQVELTTPAIEIQPSEVWEEEPRTAPFYRQLSTVDGTSWNISPSPSSSYLNIYQTDLYLNGEVSTTLTATSHQKSEFHSTVSGFSNNNEEQDVSFSQHHRDIYSTPVIEHQPTDLAEGDALLKVQSVLVVAPSPPSWNMAEASAATVAQGAMTWITSQPSSAGHLQSDFHMPAGTVAGIVVASVAFVGLIAAALGFFALRRLRPLHTKTYDTNYAGDTFSYLDNLQVSYINHHVELPKEASDEMFSLDNDSFLNSLEAMTMENYWAEESKSTKV